MRIEHAILKSLIFNETYTRKVLPFLKAEYFTDRNEKIIFEQIAEFILNYNNNPSFEALLIQISEKPLQEDEFKKTVEVLEELNTNKDEKYDEKWLIEKSEQFCQDQAIYLGVVESISIIDGKNKTLDKGSIPKILEDALSVSFNQNVGHDYINDFEARFEEYRRKEEKIPFDLTYLNKITNGGLPKGILFCLAAGTGVGKTLVKCHLASHYLQIGKNVLYITLEMSETEISKRIDSNIFNIPINELDTISREQYVNKMEKLKSRRIGRLIVKQFPTASASVLHFQHLINELKLKKNFFADIIIVDYLNICASSRMKLSGSVNSYNFVKSVTEELRGMCVTNNVPIITSTQFSRKNGANNSDPGIDDISESHGIAMTCDVLLGLIRTEELDTLNQMMVKQIKNRLNDLTLNKRFVIGVERSKMKLYDIDVAEQYDILDSGQEFEFTPKFSGLKV